MMEPRKGDSVVVDGVKFRIRIIKMGGTTQAVCKESFGPGEVVVILDRLIWDNTAGLWRVK